MRTRHQLTGASFFLLLIALAAPADAVVRRTQSPLLYQRVAVSGYAGYGVPVGEFSDSRDGFGNHESGALDWNVDLEYFAGRAASIGFSLANTTYQDKDDAELKTHVSTYSGFVRIVVPTATVVRPYLRLGMGGVQVEFQDPISRVDSEWEFSFQAGGGFLWLPARWFGINLQALYYYGDTAESILWEIPPDVDGRLREVGFNTQYFAFSAGLSLFFP